MTSASMNNEESVLHYERAPGKAACGRDLPSAGYFTDDLGMVCCRRGSRCKACWRSIVARGEATEEEGS